MRQLERTRVGNFKKEDSILLNNLQDNWNKEDFKQKHFITIEKFYEDKEKIDLSEKQYEAFLNGVKLNIQKEESIVTIYVDGKFKGTGIIENEKLKRRLVIN